MKRISTFAIALMIASSSFPQSTRKTLIDNKDCITNIQEIKDGDTSYYAYICFQNAEYKYLTDRKYLMFMHKEDLDAFVSDLSKMIETTVDKGSVTTIEGKNWRITKGYNYTSLEADGGWCFLGITDFPGKAGKKYAETPSRMVEILKSCKMNK